MAGFSLRQLVRENKGFIALMLGMAVFRLGYADYYLVPSASMYPTLREGDRIICQRTAYDLKVPLTDIILKQLNDPQRGDIVTFSSPEDGTRLIKRLIALPGDTVEMRGEELLINGKPAQYEALNLNNPDQLTPQREYPGKQQVYREKIGDHSHLMIVMPEREALRSFGPVKVPEGQYMMLGDNRDNSKDSRFIGFVPRENITGRVERVMFSLNADNNWMPRMDRFGASLKDHS